MKTLSHPTTGEIWYAVKEIDVFYFKHSTNIPLTEIEIDEVDPDNKELCQALHEHNHFALNSAGQRKWYIASTSPLAIAEREGWTDTQEGI